MKIRFTLPWGGEFHMERERMSEERFTTISLIIVGAILALFLYKLLTA